MPFFISIGMVNLAKTGIYIYKDCKSFFICMFEMPPSAEAYAGTSRTAVSLFKCEACFPNKNLGAKGSENSSSESLDSTFSQSGKSIQFIPTLLKINH